jgi:hypothetical protein
MKLDLREIGWNLELVQDRLWLKAFVKAEVKFGFF